MDIFTNREIETIFWLLLVFIIFSFNKQFRISICHIIKNIFNTKKDVKGEKCKEETSCTKNALEDLNAIKSTILRYILYCLPWLSVFIAILLIITQRLNLYNDQLIIAWLPIIVSGYCSAGLCLYTQRIFIGKIPNTFRILWYRKIIVEVASSDSNPKRISKVYEIVKKIIFEVISPDSDSNNMKIKVSVSVEEKFNLFIANMQKWLTHKAQFGMGLFILGLTFLWNPLETLYNPEFGGQFVELLTNWNHMDAWQSFIQDNWHLLNELPVSIISFTIGLMIWRMLVTSIYICKMMNEFKIEPKLGHPDMAGGLSPLGNLCLWSLIIADIPIIYLSFSLLLGALERFQNDYVPVSNYYVFQFLLLFVILGIFPLLLFFIWPVRTVHQQMRKWRNSKQELLYPIGHSINYLESKLLNEAEKIGPKGFESIQIELEGMKQIYKRSEKLPTLPLNTGIILKLFISCVIPLFGLILIPYLSENLELVSDNASSIPKIISYSIPIFSLVLQFISLNKNT